MNTGLHMRALAAATALCTALPAAAQPTATGAQLDGVARALPQAGVYSVINLWPESGAVLLNERGQAAFGSIGNEGMRNGFFDGDRIHRIGSLGGGYTVVRGLNDRGVAVGESEDAEEHSNILAFTWTAAEGMRALPGASVSSAAAINNGMQIAGHTSAPGLSARAVGWNPDRSATGLGPPPFSLSEAYSINAAGSAAGFADLGDGSIHAMLWSRGGAQTDLGDLNGGLAFGLHINDRSEVAGVARAPDGVRTLGFYWSRNSGMLPIDVEGGGARLVADLNQRGEVVGDTVADGRSLAYRWTLGQGAVPLPAGAAVRSDVFDINNHGIMVGLVERSPAEGGVRAVGWAGLSEPVDLNRLLHRPPAGLVLTAAAAVNDRGVILAHSNAGLVMLRPGWRGTDAPVLGPLQGFPAALEVGQDLELHAGFVDDARRTHSASASWSDGCASPPPTLSERDGVGEVRLRHRLCAPGFHTARLLVRGSGGRETELRQDVVVNAPELAALSGKGVLAPAPYAQAPGYSKLPLRFALWAPTAGAARGRAAATVIFSGPFQFRGEQLASASASGREARLEGSGRLNGRPGYRYAVTASDATPARLHLRISHTDPASGADIVDYDNGASAGLRQSAGASGAALAEGWLSVRGAQRP